MASADPDCLWTIVGIHRHHEDLYHIAVRDILGRSVCCRVRDNHVQKSSEFERTTTTTVLDV